ncbi:ribonuclease T [Wenzhouxiangella sp. AB-CW3]|uniref:ribonuclease T n=1 Tax=Wenzhouxiangella sp. AB-CW3 TaxID=2771012 RepID=UPI00168C0E76|nr:ribonuclease T [Wenzhouxiangella sp. AB-CW3]QOC21504.1 ribonuclease T [Wenzhouxiangella sp. AB-CW3]
MSRIANRFRGFLPVVVDVETGGFNPQTDALLELAVCIIEMDEDGWTRPGEVHMRHVEPFEGANIETAALEFNGIRPDHPLRPAVEERRALQELFLPVRQTLRATGCKRAVLVGHNAHFDLSFLNAAIARTSYKRNPFHPFSCFDTATMGGLAYGQTVLARAVQAAGLDWDKSQAHSAAYDTERTASLFCNIVNRWRHLEELEEAGHPYSA